MPLPRHLTRCREIIGNWDNTVHSRVYARKPHSPRREALLKMTVGANQSMSMIIKRGKECVPAALGIATLLLGSSTAIAADTDRHTASSLPLQGMADRRRRTERAAIQTAEVDQQCECRIAYAGMVL